MLNFGMAKQKDSANTHKLKPQKAYNYHFKKFNTMAEILFYSIPENSIKESKGVYYSIPNPNGRNSMVIASNTKGQMVIIPVANYSTKNRGQWVAQFRYRDGEMSKYIPIYIKGFDPVIDSFKNNYQKLKPVAKEYGLSMQDIFRGISVDGKEFNYRVYPTGNVYNSLDISIKL